MVPPSCDGPEQNVSSNNGQIMAHHPALNSFSLHSIPNHYRMITDPDKSLNAHKQNNDMLSANVLESIADITKPGPLATHNVPSTS